MNGRLVILAGGVSSRMKQSFAGSQELDCKLLNDAEQKSKSMIRLGEGERPFLDYLLLNARLAGYEEIVIVVSEKDNSIKDYYKSKKNDSWFEGIVISYATQIIPAGRTKPLGTADALLQALLAKKSWKGLSFTMCNSDNLYSLNAFRMMINSDYPNAMIDYNREDLGVEKERVEKFAVTKKDTEGFLVDIIEKPSLLEIESVKSASGFVGVSMNIFKFSYDMIRPALEIVPINEIRNEKELPTAVKLMLDKFPKSLFCYPLRETVPDLTSKQDILKVKSFLNKTFILNNHEKD
ncbi:MAG: nucleotidyl transferase [Ignavibacteria bacterium]|nr:MAG: nucleotidyl transferase [Ignavibacteria bacterium]KAF0158315.1 MAG: nucleotidyl transferase [Ignavibacteria bacterium]